MTITVQTFNGHPINDGIAYHAYALAGDDLFAREVKPILHARMGRHPSYQREDRLDSRVRVRISVASANETTDPLTSRLETLHKWLPLGQEGDLVILHDTSLRKVRAFVERVIPQDGAPNRFTVLFRVPDPRWISDREILYDNGGISCNGDNLVTDSIRTAGDEGDGLAVIAQGSTGIWPAATNIAENSSGETDTLGWGTLGASGAPVRQTSIKLFGTASIKGTYSTSTTILTFESGGVGVGNTFTAGKVYLASAWVLIGAGWNGGDIRLNQYRMDADTSGAEFFEADALHLGGSLWQFVQCLWIQDTTAQGGVKFKALTAPVGAARVFYVESLMIEEFDSKAEATFSPHILTDGAADSHTYGLCTADANDYSTAQSWFMARIRVGWQPGWSAAKTRKHTIFGWYGDADNYIHAYWQESAGTGAMVVERKNGGVLDTHSVNLTISMDTLQTERDYATVCFAWTNGLLRISKNGAAFVDSGATSTNGIPAITNPLVEVGSMNEADQLCGDVVWAAAGSGTMDNAEVSTLYNGGSDTLPTVFAAAGAQFFAWDANDSTAGDGITEFKLFNNGTIRFDEARVVIQPITQKLSANSWTYSRDIVLANRVPRSFVNYAIDISDGGLDTAALTTAKALANGDDFRFLLDGIEAPRWFGEDAGVNDFDTANTSIWVNLDLEPSKSAGIAIAVGSSATEFTFGVGDLAGWPEAGFFLVDDECVRYASRTDTVMSGCTRAQRGTTAASHSAVKIAYWVQRRLQFMYGYSGASAPDSRPDLKPVIKLDDSLNTNLFWDDVSRVFDDDNPRRSMQWARVLREVESLQNRFAISTVTSGFAILFRFRQNGPVPGEIASNTASIALPTGTGQDGSGDVITLSSSNDYSNRTAVFGLDTEGNRRLVGTFTPTSATGVATESFDSPGDDLISMELQANLGRVIGTPQIDAIGSNEIDLGTSPGVSHRQPFTVPSAKQAGKGSIDGFAAYIKMTDNDAVAYNITMTCKIQKEDPDAVGTYVDLASATLVLTETSQFGGQNYSPRYFFFANPVAVVPGDSLSMLIEYTSKASGTVSGGVRWGGATLSYNGAVQVRDFFGYSQTLDHDGIAELPDDGDGSGLDDIDIHLNADGVPAMVVGAEEADAYFVDAVIANAATGQSVTVEALVRVNDELEIDMETGAATNLTQDVGIANLANFSDEDKLVEIAPGENPITYTEADLVAVAIEARYRHTWQ